jgi:hypothetical protein
VHGGQLFRGKQADKQNFIHAAAKSLFAVDFDDGDAFVIALAEDRIGVDIDQARFLAVAAEKREGVVAEVTSVAGVEDDVRHGASE